MTLSTAARRQLDALLTAQPEAAPWLSLLSEVLAECAAPSWQAAASRTRLRPQRDPGAPLLAGAEIPIDAVYAEHWLRRVLALVGNAGPDASPLIAASASHALDPLALLEMVINEDHEGLAASASALGVPEEALAVAAGLAATPLLQAMRRHFGGAVGSHWQEGFCPICGGWPLLAELRGLERARRLRCGRCGSDWAQPGVRCPFCAASGHGALASLVPEEGGEARKVETCTHCRGYLKTISTLRAWESDEIPLADLATVELDLAAIEREYLRPTPRGCWGVRVLGC